MTTKELAIELSNRINPEDYKAPWLMEVCKLTLEYITLEGLEDAKRAIDIELEVFDIVDNQ